MFLHLLAHSCSTGSCLPVNTQLPLTLRKPAPHTLPPSHLRLSNKKSIENLLLFTSNRSSYDWFLNDCSASSGSNRSSLVNSPWLNHPSNFEGSPSMHLVGLPTCDSLLCSTPIGSCLSKNACSEPYAEILDNPSIPFPTVNQVTSRFPIHLCLFHFCFIILTLHVSLNFIGIICTPCFIKSEFYVYWSW